MRLVVLGAGESGVGTAILGKKKGYDVFVSDFGKISPKYKQELINREILWEEEKHTEELILNADVVMKSPGITDKVPIVKKLIEKGIHCISEIEFAAPFTNATILGITGSNGKTTTTMLTHHLLKLAELNVGIGGNVGKSFAWQVAEKEYDYYVLELSSFQIDGIINFRPHIAVITNITPDHLDRYDYNFQNYVNSKFRITKNQTQEDYLIYDADDPVILQWLEENKTKIKPKTIPFSLTKTFDEGAYLNKNNMKVTIKKETMVMEVKEIALEGKHNLKNTMAASLEAKILQIRDEVIRKSLQTFQGVEHRLEKVLKIKGIQYINDSKATNVNSVFYALDSMTTPTVWIVGGVDKGNDYEELMPLVREKVKAIVCLGIDNSKIKRTFEKVVDFLIEVNTMEDAVKISQRLSEKGDTVLLSPACASFDLFDDYKERGNQFKREVRNL